MSAWDAVVARARDWVGKGSQLSWVVPIERDHWETQREFQHRRKVTVVTLAVGTPVLRYALSRKPGSREFYASTLVLAGIWAGGAFASGPLHAGWSSTRNPGKNTRPVVRPMAIGAGAVVFFAAGAAVIARIPALRRPVLAVLNHARFGSLPVVVPLTLITGVGEEFFFRGALYAATKQPHQIAVTTAVYTVATGITGNPMLVFAAGVLGLLVAIERRTTGGVQGPIIIHLTWSTGMLLVLPPLIEYRR
ncbi:CPBP family intramembrane glutamic endopeptidase [Allobranchiibius sp. GilTou38]|uniref:CPBP family intramembrane glutamic endopeptidase n=1 Tax=Allobranchiibius sp. GilTou38 TaxID=2815210 RepID=UPI001AA1A9E7|nr:CPBP family intramembrane glutamic endopeptidase [Allobranchiibius sp. GilTou38]MBO1767077.1 CPBP family intramembrane metalloprotease [Allobranchiibius sp. GilTou38]